jgi:GNAT superfamily N-acetyltransferase
MSDDYRLINRPPTPEEYYAICVAVGWRDVINFDAAPRSLERSLYGVVALYGEQAVGMGRIVGDGAIYFYIQDIAVMPAHQGQGVGTRIMTRLMSYLRRHAPHQAFVGLFAAQGTQPFYHGFSFHEHPDLTGMFTVIWREPEEG